MASITRAGRMLPGYCLPVQSSREARAPVGHPVSLGCAYKVGRTAISQTGCLRCRVHAGRRPGRRRYAATRCHVTGEVNKAGGPARLLVIRRLLRRLLGAAGPERVRAVIKSHGLRGPMAACRAASALPGTASLPGSVQSRRWLGRSRPQQAAGGVADKAASATPPRHAPRPAPSRPAPTGT